MVEGGAGNLGKKASEPQVDGQLSLILCRVASVTTGERIERNDVCVPYD